jgi:hypothetical protein
VPEGTTPAATASSSVENLGPDWVRIAAARPFGIAAARSAPAIAAAALVRSFIGPVRFMSLSTLCASRRRSSDERSAAVAILRPIVG